MMGEHELSHLRKPGNCTRVLDRAMAPADFLWVLAGEVLRVVHDQVGTCKKLSVAAVFPEEVADAGSKCVRMRFVITRIDESDTVRLKPVAQGKRRMIEVAAGNLDLSSSQPPLDEL